MFCWLFCNFHKNQGETIKFLCQANPVYSPPNLTSHLCGQICHPNLPIFTVNTLLQRVEFGIWLKPHRKIRKFQEAKPTEISNLSLVFERQIPLSTEGCLWLTSQHLLIDWKMCGIWAKFSRFVKIWNFQLMKRCCDVNHKH